MKILITGGSGFIGSHLVEHFQGKAEVRVLDNLCSGFRANLAGLDCEFIEGSILDREAVRAAMQGNNPAVPKREEMIPEPASPYAISKLDGEYHCQLFAATGRVSTVALRYFNVFGPRQNPASAYAAAVPIFIHRALRNEPITIYGDGAQTRDFISVRDVARANAFFATESPLTGVFNVARGGSLSIGDLAARIVRLTGSSSQIIHGPERPGDVRHSTASLEKLTAAGFAPALDFDTALRETIESCKATPGR